MRLHYWWLFQESEARSGRNCNTVGSEGWRVSGICQNEQKSWLRSLEMFFYFSCSSFHSMFESIPLTRLLHLQCPDPGCKTSNPCGQANCSNCNLPKHSAQQFQRGQSKILKQLWIFTTTHWSVRDITAGAESNKNRFFWLKLWSRYFLKDW